jgi:solute:Na+ symporter, SSS family
MRLFSVIDSNRPPWATCLFPVLVLLVIPYLLVGVIAAGKFLQSTTAGSFPVLFALPDVVGSDGLLRPNSLSGGIPPWLGSWSFAWWCCVTCLRRRDARRGLGEHLSDLGLHGHGRGCVLHDLLAHGRIWPRPHGWYPRAISAPVAWRGRDLVGQWQFFSYFLIPLSVGMFPHIFQHWLTARSARTFRLTVVAHPICILIVWVPCILIGVWATVQFGPDANPNAVLGRMVNTLVHSPYLTGLLGAGSGGDHVESRFPVHVPGTMFTNDIVVRRFGHDRFTDRQKILMARGFHCGRRRRHLSPGAAAQGQHPCVRSWGSGVSAGLPHFSHSSLPPSTGAASTRAGAIASLAATAIVWSVLFYRDIFSAKPPGAGRDELLIFGFMPVAFIVAAATVTLVVVSLLTQPPRPDTIRQFFDLETDRPAIGAGCGAGPSCEMTRRKHACLPQAGTLLYD